jgi:transcriptional regulator with XRE-family HTH domain
MSTAAVNIREQEGLLKLLQEAYGASGLSLAEVASRLGVAPEMAEEALFGGRDLSLTELRYLALVLNVVVEYTVRKPAPGEEDTSRRPRAS